MRTKFKLCYKEGFKLSGSTSFELRVRNNTYLHTTPACQHPTRHMIGRHAPFRFVSQPRQGMFAEPSCYTASYSLVSLSFQPHCKSLLSLERQIVPCLQHSSMAGGSFWMPESKSFGFFLSSPAVPATLGQQQDSQLRQSNLLLNCDGESYHYTAGEMTEAQFRLAVQQTSWCTVYAHILWELLHEASGRNAT